MEINIFPDQSTSNEIPSGQETNPNNSEIQIHQLPCSIYHNGRANIENYFVVNPIFQEEPLYETFFRGRRLVGRCVMLDDKHEGCIFKESSHTLNKPSSLTTNEEIEETRSWETSHKFHSFMVWEHDTVPLPSNNRLLSSLDWLEIANVVSS
ncbi:28597_t:CDS:2 [Dentiscutata erythropus]|uniref:28597_t:CDS:1 n=1 Tax=Dentiscutata erythropus TaxID=1348616 RepID=A0A9N9GXP4_9GLOM|nr:28597_t:CDS:2 [Dentiscutata erythropus]